MNEMIFTIARSVAEVINLPWEKSLETILRFNLASEGYQSFPKSGKLVFTPNDFAALEKYFLSYLKRYQSEVSSRLVLSEVQTIPDPALDVILRSFAKLENTSQVSELHRKAMAAENLLGGLLERYIAANLQPIGWVWCAGNTVRAVDFLSSDMSLAVQIKNRDNSENSSSSAIRAGTSIQKWFRIYSKTGKTNWEAFPQRLDPPLSEDGFYVFIENYSKTGKITT